jgi:rhodanese-related sulfurtransferase
MARDPNPLRPGLGWFEESRGAPEPGRRGALAALLALTGGGAGAAVLHGIATAPFPDPADPRVSLGAVERAVFREQPLAEITEAGLAQRLATAAAATVLFDLRAEAEHAAGHIAGAFVVSPFVTAPAFLAAHGATMAGRVAVFVDLAGLASGALILRLRPALSALRPAACLRLRGGVLGWWAAGRKLAGEGRLVLPDAGWRALAERARLSPA